MQPPPPLFLLSGRLTNPLAASLTRPLHWESMLHTVTRSPIGGVSPICIAWKIDRNISLLVGVVWVGISKRVFVRRWLPCSSELIPWIISVTPLNAEQHYSAAAEDKDNYVAEQHYCAAEDKDKDGYNGYLHDAGITQGC